MGSHLTRLLALCGCLLWLGQTALARPDTKDIFDLKIRVQPRDTVRCGDVITVFIEFANSTGIALNNFEVRAFFPNEIEKYCRLLDVLYNTEKHIPVIADLARNKFALWQIGTLQAGKRDSIIFRLVLQRPPGRQVFFTYTATARAAGTNTSEVSFFNTYAPPCPPGGRSPDVGISKTADKTKASVGDRIQFALNLTNTSLDTAFDVAVEDSVPPGFAVDFLRISHPFSERQTLPTGMQVIRWLFPGPFPPGGRTTITIPTIVTLNPRIPALLINQCDIASATSDYNSINDHAEDSVLIVPKYDIRLASSGEKDKIIAPNTNEQYTLEISNHSTVRVENFNFTLTINDGFAGSDLYTITDISDGGTSPDNATVQWQIAGLDTGQAITRSLRLVYDRVGVGTPGRCVNFAALVDTTFNVQNTVQVDLNPANNKAGWRRCLNDVFDLVLQPTQDNNKPAAAVKQPQIYKLEFTNNSLLTLPTFTLHAELQPVVPTVAGNINITTSQGGTINGLQIDWTIPALAPNVTDSRIFEVTITGINAGGTFGFTLRGEVPVFAGESDTTNNRRTWETRATVVTNLVVVDVTSTPADVNIGGTANIKIDYANRGSLDKASAELRAVLTATPNAPIFRIANAGDGRIAANTITWTIQPLPATGPAAQGSRSFDLIFDNVAQAANYNVKILGVIDRHDAADPLNDNRDSVNVRLAAQPQLFLSDITLAGKLESDQTLVYSFTYGNLGTFAATNATLELKMPQVTLEWTDAGGTPLSSTTRLELGDLAPSFQAPMTVRMKIIKREDLLRSFGGGTAVELKFDVTLAATNAPPPIAKSRLDQLPVPRLVEGFFLTRNKFQPETQGDVEIHFDMIKDANVGFKIYNLAGELVRSFAPQAGVVGSRVRQIWDGRNDTGELVASGLYFVFAEADYKSERPYRKLIVVR
jgi:uncharacterized repeat protein (TIGR01451 family)